MRYNLVTPMRYWLLPQYHSMKSYYNLISHSSCLFYRRQIPSSFLEKFTILRLNSFMETRQSLFFIQEGINYSSTTIILSQTATGLLNIMLLALHVSMQSRIHWHHFQFDLSCCFEMYPKQIIANPPYSEAHRRFSI
jgi:hypothetical protein